VQINGDPDIDRKAHLEAELPSVVTCSWDTFRDVTPTEFCWLTLWVLPTSAMKSQELKLNADCFVDNYELGTKFHNLCVKIRTSNWAGYEISQPSYKK
jgi:hypothetical protein